MSLTVIGIGEVVWDLLPTGPQLGGAPANFACHARSLGVDALVVTRVGDDCLGRDVLQRFKAKNLSDAMVQLDDELPTGTVTVSLSGQGVPQFTVHENVAWDRLVVTKSVLDTVRRADAVCFGSLAQRTPASRAAIQELVAAAPVGALKLFDINLRRNFYSREVVEQSLSLANMLKLNDSELATLREMFLLKGGARRQMEALSHTFGLKAVVLTCGPEGSLIYQKGQWSEQPSQPVSVVDTVGAGDSFAATLTVGLLKGWDLNEVHALAAEIARYVCSEAGATPTLPEYLRSKFVP